MGLFWLDFVRFPHGIPVIGESAPTKFRRVGGVVYRTALLTRRGITAPGGSNPPPSDPDKVGIEGRELRVESREDPSGLANEAT